MKKYFFVFSLFLLICSCTNEQVELNNAAFQTLKDNVFWRAQEYQAYQNLDGKIKIEGVLGTEKVILYVPSSAIKTYVLGMNDDVKATYSNIVSSLQTNFATGKDTGSGQIVITDYNVVTNSISGTFKFNAPNSDKTAVNNLKVNFTEGVFYKVPVEQNVIN